MNLTFQVSLFLFKLYILFEIIVHEFFTPRATPTPNDEEAALDSLSEKQQQLETTEEIEDSNTYRDVIDVRECVYLAICVALIVFDWTMYYLTNCVDLEKTGMLVCDSMSCENSR